MVSTMFYDVKEAIKEANDWAETALEHLGELDGWPPSDRIGCLIGEAMKLLEKAVNDDDLTRAFKEEDAWLDEQEARADASRY